VLAVQFSIIQLESGIVVHSFTSLFVQSFVKMFIFWYGNSKIKDSKTARDSGFRNLPLVHSVDGRKKGLS
jgi:hypothetical protein